MSHRLLMPPHPGGFYLSSALCSCGDWQYDADSEGDLNAAYRDVLRAHTAHAEPRPPALDVDWLTAEIVAYYGQYDHHEVWNERGARALARWLSTRAEQTGRPR